MKKDVIVFGMGKYLEWKKETILNEYNIVGFLDNKVKECKSVSYGGMNTVIRNPADIDSYDENLSIFLTSAHFVDMWRQLCEAGVNPERIVYPFNIHPFFEHENILHGQLESITFHEKFFECKLKNEKTVSITTENEWRCLLRKLYRNKYAIVNSISQMETDPVSRYFGAERGTPIDRYYIDQFLKSNQNLICGDVLEIEDALYTKTYGGSQVKNSIVMDVNATSDNITFNGNLETGEGIKSEIADCFILTQTLMYIFDVKAAAHNIEKLLKKGGTALITCSGISQNSVRCMDNYGCYFNFNAKAIERMFEDEKNMKVVNTGSFGNVKTVSAHINGLCFEDLSESDFIPNDQYYPLIVYGVVKKDAE